MANTGVAMAQSTDINGLPGDEPARTLSALSAALSSFDAVRTALADQAKSEFRPRRPRSDVLFARDMAMMAEMNGIHDALPEVDQLRIYRFFLTAVHRNSVASHRFDSVVIVSPERSAALEAEFHDISHDLNLIVDEVAHHALHEDKRLAQQLAATFLWSTSWWIHARLDVTVFAPRLGDEDLLTSLMLGQAPEQDECVVAQMYQCAAKAELEYRRGLMMRPVENLKVAKPFSDFSGGQVPLAIRQESHM